MRDFVLRARKGPTTPEFSLDELTRRGHLEIVAHCIVNSLFYAQKIRPDSRVQVCLDGPAAPPKTVRFEGEGLFSMGGFDERAICTALQRALEAGRRLGRSREIEVDGGLFVAKRSFEEAVRLKAEAGPLYYLRPGGRDIRDTDLELPAAFVFSDHLSMPKKTDRFLERLGAVPLSVGPRMLFASQCAVLVHNELDRRGFD